MQYSIIEVVLQVCSIVFRYKGRPVRALTVPIVGGLVASTLFTVVAIPVMYTFIDRWGMRKVSE